MAALRSKRKKIIYLIKSSLTLRNKGPVMVCGGIFNDMLDNISLLRDYPRNQGVENKKPIIYNDGFFYGM